MGITQPMVETLLEDFQSMAYANSFEAFEALKKEFMKTAPQAVRDYFVKNWAGINEEWVMGFKSESGHFFNNTNNRVESLNQKLKEVIRGG